MQPGPKALGFCLLSSKQLRLGLCILQLEGPSGVDGPDHQQIRLYLRPRGRRELAQAPTVSGRQMEFFAPSSVSSHFQFFK